MLSAKITPNHASVATGRRSVTAICSVVELEKRFKNSSLNQTLKRSPKVTRPLKVFRDDGYLGSRRAVVGGGLDEVRTKRAPPSWPRRTKRTGKAPLPAPWRRKKLADAVQQRDGEEHDDRRERRRQHRESDLLPAFLSGDLRRFAHFQVADRCSRARPRSYR